ncbi:unnamed protein product, partial [marine sediment metagenome]
MSMYLVTGGAGFIGSNIVEELVKRGENVKVLDNLSEGKIENIEPYLNKIEFIKGDIRDIDIVNKAVRGVDYILHQAALRSVPKSMMKPKEYNEVNVGGTLNILIAAKETKVKRVVFASSSSVYGNTDKFPEKETDVLNPVSPYAATKLMGEYHCKSFSNSFGLETVSLRYFNVFGPRQSLENEYAVVIPKFITCILKGENPPIYGDGHQSRDFIFISNVIEANLKAIESPGISGEVFNIACGKDYTVLELLRILNEIMDTDIKPVFMSSRPGDVKKTFADVTK